MVVVEIAIDPVISFRKGGVQPAHCIRFDRGRVTGFSLNGKIQIFKENDQIVERCFDVQIHDSILLVLKQSFATVQSFGDAVGLALSANGR